MSFSEQCVFTWFNIYYYVCAHSDDIYIIYSIHTHIMYIYKCGHK